jgi:hypothetical protein
MRSVSLVFCLAFFICVTPAVQAAETPFELGTADLASDSRFEALKQSAASLSVGTSDMEQAFQYEAVKQLDLKYVEAAPTELEKLQQANLRLQARVSELEHRLAAVEAKLAE